MILDLSHLPSPTDWKQGVAGYSVCRDACLPTSTQKATAWAKRHKRNGARLVRLHKFDAYLNSDTNYTQLQWMLNALKRQGIVASIEFSCERPLTVEGIQRLCRLDLSNVVLAAIKNETVLPDYAKWESVIRDSGYTGLLFGSNASMMGGEFGDVESAHLYVGKIIKNDAGEIELFFNCQFPNHTDHNDEPNLILRRRPDLPYCIMEAGTPYPNPQRGYSDVLLYDYALRSRGNGGLGASVVCSFCYASSALGMGDLEIGVDEWGLPHDPLRMMAFQWLALGGWPYVPFSNMMQAEFAPDALYLTSPTLRVLQASLGL
jgi:hypothetical protein